MIECGDVLLRSHVMQDAKAIADLANDPLIGHMTHLPYPYALKDAKIWLKQQKKRQKQGDHIGFSILLAKTQELIGAIELELFDHAEGEAELGIWIGAPFRHKGYASMAAQALIKYAVQSTALTRLMAHVRTDNMISRQLVKSIGMQRGDEMLLSSGAVMEPVIAYQLDLHVYRTDTSD